MAVDCLVAEAVVLGDGQAALLTRVEGDCEAGGVKAEAPLAQGAEVGGGNGRAAHGDVGEAHHEGGGGGGEGGGEGGGAK